MPLESTETTGLPQRGDSASCGYYATYLYEVQEYDVGTLQVVKDSICFDSVNTRNYERRHAYTSQAKDLILTCYCQGPTCGTKSPSNSWIFAGCTVLQGGWIYGIITVLC